MIKSSTNNEIQTNETLSAQQRAESYSIIDDTQRELDSSIKILLRNEKIFSRAVSDSGMDAKVLKKAMDTVAYMNVSTKNDLDKLDVKQRNQYLTASNMVATSISALKKSENKIEVKMSDMASALGSSLKSEHLTEKHFANIVDDIGDMLDTLKDPDFNRSILSDIKHGDKRSKEKLDSIMDKLREQSTGKVIKESFGTLSGRFDTLFTDLEEYTEKMETRVGGKSVKALAQQGVARSEKLGGVGAFMLNSLGPAGQIASTAVAALNDLTGKTMSERLTGGFAAATEKVFTKKTFDFEKTDKNEVKLSDADNQTTPIKKAVEETISETAPNQKAVGTVKAKKSVSTVSTQIKAEEGRDKVDRDKQSLENSDDSLDLLESIDGSLKKLLDKGGFGSGGGSDSSDGSVVDTIKDVGLAVAGGGGTIATMRAMMSKMLDKVPGGKAVKGVVRSGIDKTKAVVSGGKTLIGNAGKTIVSGAKSVGTKIAAPFKAVTKTGLNMAKGLGSKLIDNPLTKKLASSAMAKGLGTAAKFIGGKILMPLGVAYDVYQTGVAIDEGIGAITSGYDADAAEAKSKKDLSALDKRRAKAKDKIKAKLSKEILASESVSSTLFNTSGAFGKLTAAGVIYKKKDGTYQLTDDYLGKQDIKIPKPKVKKETSWWSSIKKFGADAVVGTYETLAGVTQDEIDATKLSEDTAKLQSARLKKGKYQKPVQTKIKKSTKIDTGQNSASIMFKKQQNSIVAKEIPKKKDQAQIRIAELQQLMKQSMLQGNKPVVIQSTTKSNTITDRFTDSSVYFIDGDDN